VASKNEAMLHATPVIGFNSAGTAELIEHGKTGLLYNSKEELCESIKVLQTNPGLRTQLIENALAFGKDHFTNEIYASKIVEIYKKLVDEG